MYMHIHSHTCTYIYTTYICIYVYILYTYIYTHPMCTYIYLPYIYLPAPMNHVKIFKGWPPGDAPSKLVQLWYKSCRPDQRGKVEMKKPTILSNKTSTA